MNKHTVQRVWQVVIMIAVVASLAGTARAATTGQLSGYVVDDDGSPLPGVSVSASSPTQIGGVQSTESDVQGWFQYPRLNPGYFTVRLELDGFLAQELTQVQVRLGRMSQVHVTMPLATFGDEVTVTETTPVVDPRRVSTGQVFAEDFLEDAAIGINTRFFYSQIVLQAAGTSSRDPGGESGLSWGISVLGSTGPENIFQIDGLDTSNPYWGGAQIFLPPDSIQEVAFESGGYGAEYGRGTGGVINALTKSGGNVFSGTLDARYTDNDLATSGEHFDPEEQVASSMIWDATLGGRLVRDRVWFFGALGSFAVVLTPTGAPTSQEEIWDQGFAKVTGQATPSWLALGKYQRNRLESTNWNSSQFTAPEATARTDWEQSVLQAEVSGVLSQSLLWELQVGSQSVEEDWGPMSGDTSTISHYNLVTGMDTGNYWQMWNRKTGRDQFGSQLTWFVDDALGSHELKLGADYQQTSMKMEYCWTGFEGGGFCPAREPGFSFEDLVDETGEAIPYVMWDLVPPGAFEVTGVLPSLMFQDSWRVRPDVTLQLGLRWDRSTYENDVGERVANLELLQPRLGVTWDLTRNGRNLLRASWGRFMHSGFLTLPRLSTIATETYGIWLSCSLPPEYGGPGLTNPSECAAMADSRGVSFRTDPEGWDPAGWLLINTLGSDPSLIASDLAPQHADTLIVGFERELLRRTSLELSFVEKATRDVLEDTCVENYPTPTADAGCSAFIIANLPQARRDYRAWILNFESRALDRLHVLASYTNSDSKGSTHSNSAEWEFDLYPYHYENLYGFLDHHREHRVKASGYVFLPLDFGVGFSGVWGSPFRWTPRVRASSVSPELFHWIFLEPRGSREGDEWSQLDVQLTKGFTLGRVRLQLLGAVINLFDSENTTEVCDNVSGCGDLELGDPINWQQPRRYELGVRVEF